MSGSSRTDPNRSSRYKKVQDICNHLNQKYYRDSLSSAPQKNLDNFMIYDSGLQPYYQKMSKDRRTDYRVGYLIDPKSKSTEISINISYNVPAIKIFSQNFDMFVFKKIISDLNFVVNAEKTILWSSKTALKKSKNDGRKKINYDNKTFEFTFKSFQDFKEELEAIGVQDFPQDLGCKPPNTGLDLRPGNSGSHFEFKVVVPNKAVGKAVDLLFPMFRWLTPRGQHNKKPGRNADLARALKNVHKICSFKGCSKKKVEAAHIKAHSAMGSDQRRNGIWLCHEHHGKQERKPKSWQKKKMKKKSMQGTDLEKFEI